MSDTPASLPLGDDAEKVALEREKLDLEIRRLKHFWRDPDFWIKAIILIVAVVTVWGTVWFSFLGREVNKLEADKDKLTDDIKVLEHDKARLANTNGDLEKANKALTADKTALTTDVGSLRAKVATDTFDVLLALLTEQLAPSEEAKTDFMMEGPFIPGPARDLIKTMRDDSVHRPQLVQQIEKVLSVTPSRPLKAELLVILSEGTHDYLRKNAISREFLDLVRPGIDWGAFSQGASTDERYAALLLLGEMRTWDEPEKLSVCRSLIAGLELDKKQPASRKLLVLKTVFGEILFPPFSLQGLTKDALDVTLRSFAIARDVVTSQKETDEDRLQAMRFISRLAHEAVIAVVATVLADSDTSDDLRSDLEEFASIFPARLNRPKDDDADHWEEWVSEHEDVVEPYMDSDLSKLKDRIIQARKDRKGKKGRGFD